MNLREHFPIPGWYSRPSVGLTAPPVSAVKLASFAVVAFISLIVVGAAAGQPTIDLPLDPAVQGKITQGFNEGDHAGEFAVDVGIDSGTAVLAPMDGYVFYARFANGGLAAASSTP